MGSKPYGHPANYELVTADGYATLIDWASSAQAVDLQCISTSCQYLEINRSLQQQAVLKKHEPFEKTSLLRNAATRKYIASQRHLDNTKLALTPVEVHYARRVVSSVLPKLSQTVYRDILRGCGWSAGSHGLTVQGRVTPPHKEGDVCGVTPSASNLAYLDYCLNRSAHHTRSFNGDLAYHWSHSHDYQRLRNYMTFRSLYVSTDADVFSTVPKNSSTDRPICIGPGGNVRLQLGVGRYIKKRLLSKLGIDLSKQTRNREYARRASAKLDFYDQLATIDLQDASDTISTELVKELLPSDWYDLLDSLRAKRLKIRGIPTSPSRFTGMGCAFTFELETLIFYALCVASMQANSLPFDPTCDLTVYGDDIICPSPYADKVISTLERAKFIVNRAKSFCQGDFRESCGHDFYRGRFIRPFYLRKDIRLNGNFYLAINTLMERIGEYDTLNGCAVAQQELLELLLKLRRGRCHTIPPTNSYSLMSGIRVKHFKHAYAYELRPRHRRRSRFCYSITLRDGARDFQVKNPIRGDLIWKRVKVQYNGSSRPHLHDLQNTTVFL